MKKSDIYTEFIENLRASKPRGLTELTEHEEMLLNRWIQRRDELQAGE